MHDRKATVAKRCLDGAEANTMTFPEAVATLAGEGFEGYAVDFRRGAATYYVADGDSIDLPTHRAGRDVAATFDPAGLRAAIRQAQEQVPGYTCEGFCAKAAAAGCAGYVVSFPGRRVLYVGRTAETHVEHFPT